MLRPFLGQQVYQYLFFTEIIAKYYGDSIYSSDDIAVISIESSQGCSDLYRYTDNYHILESNEHILNLEFDDIGEDIVYDGFEIKKITEEQASTIYNFIKSNIGRNFIIHCRAGKSRSQAIVRTILDMYPDMYGECCMNRENPCLTPNVEVFTQIKRFFYFEN